MNTSLRRLRNFCKPGGFSLAFGAESDPAFRTPHQLARYALSACPDLIVGLDIVALNAGAAQEVWNTAREEHGRAQT